MQRLSTSTGRTGYVRCPQSEPKEADAITESGNDRASEDVAMVSARTPERYRQLLDQSEKRDSSPGEKLRSSNHSLMDQRCHTEAEEVEPDADDIVPELNLNVGNTDFPNELEQTEVTPHKRQSGKMKTSAITEADSSSAESPQEVSDRVRLSRQWSGGQGGPGGGSRCGCFGILVLDPSGRLSFWWSAVVSAAFVYNFWVLVFRSVFDEVAPRNVVLWFSLDYTADLFYVFDMALQFRTGYLGDGILQRRPSRTTRNYLNSAVFYVDCLSLLPLDLLYFWIGIWSTLRFTRLLKVHRFWELLDRTERHTNHPNLVRTLTLLHYLFALYHWNACLIHLVVFKYQMATGIQLVRWESGNEDVVVTYLRSLYLSTLSLTTMGRLRLPQSKWGYVFGLVQFVSGLLLYATVLGHVANIVTNVSFARKEFQGKCPTLLRLINYLFRNRNHGISRTPLKSQAHQHTSVFTSAPTKQTGCPKGRLWYAQVRFPKGQWGQNRC